MIKGSIPILCDAGITPEFSIPCTVPAATFMGKCGIEWSGIMLMGLCIGISFIVVYWQIRKW